MKKVLIRAHTCRRDAAPAELLAGVLRSMGHDVIVASIRMFTNCLITWRPDAVIIFTPSVAPKIRAILPKVKIIFSEGECLMVNPSDRSDYFRENRKIYDSIDLIQMCGEAQRIPFLEWAGDSAENKIKIVGNLKLDLARFLPEKLKTSKKSNSIGVVGRFHTLNHYEADPAFLHIVTEASVDYMINNVKSFLGTFQSIEAILKETDLTISIRPHPLEAMDSYNDLLSRHFSPDERKRIEVDRSIDFPSWAAKQKALISPTSASFLEASVLGVPVINLDKIYDVDKYNRDHAQAAEEWQNGAILPKNIDELCSLLVKNISLSNMSESIVVQLNEQSDFNCKQASVLRISHQIVDLLYQDKNRVLFGLPKWLVLLRDEVSFKRIMKRNPLHANFNYKSGYHPIPEHFKPMIDTILKDDSLENK